MDSYIYQHLGKYQQLVEVSHHVKFQLPNEHTRVSNLIDSIEYSDAAFQATIAIIRQNTNGMRDDFEKAAIVILTVDSYVKNNANKKSTSFQILALGKAKSFGREEQTGVDLRWYKADEYTKLKPAKKIELNAWQQTDEGKKSVASEKKAFHMPKKKSRERDDSQSSKKIESNKTATKYPGNIAAFKQELSEMKEKSKVDDFAAKVEALLNISKNFKVLNNESMSIARQVMAINDK